MEGNKGREATKTHIKPTIQNKLCGSYQILQFCLTKGMTLTKVHKGAKFKQRCWLKPWMGFNTEKRSNTM